MSHSLDLPTLTEQADFLITWQWKFHHTAYIHKQVAVATGTLF
jgi:hypothetical protein